MSGKKHVFKIVPGEQLSDTNSIPIFEGTSRLRHDEYNLARVNFKALDDEGKIELSLPLQLCQIAVAGMSDRYTEEISCLKEDGEKLNLFTTKQNRHADASDKDYIKVELDEVPSLIKGKSYSLSIFDKESGECCVKSKIRTDSSFDSESAKKSLSDTGDFSILLDDAYKEISAVIPGFERKPMFYYPFISVYDQADNKIASIPGLSLAYFNGRLANIYISSLAGEEPLCVLVIPQEHEYITLESNGDDYQLYLSDNQGNRVEDENPQVPSILVSDIVLNNSVLYNDYSNLKEIILSSELKEIISSNTFTQIFAQDLAGDQLKTLTNTFNDKQLKVLAEHLTDNQLQALVDHLTHHQLQTLAQELNPEKLQIIVPVLNDAQLEALVRDLNPEQVREILPHLKMDQFEAFIASLNDEQLTVLAKDLAGHHLTILSKELKDDQLGVLVNSLRADKLNDLVNKLDHEKLAVIARDLTDPDRIKVIIDSLITNSEKLQTFAHNLSDQQFAKLLNELTAEGLKDIIHKLPYEKVISVVGDFGNKDQSSAVIEMLEEKFEEQNAKQGEMMKILRQLEKDKELTGDEAWQSSKLSSETTHVQNTSAEPIVIEEYTQVESMYL